MNTQATNTTVAAVAKKAPATKKVTPPKAKKVETPKPEAPPVPVIEKDLGRRATDKVAQEALKDEKIIIPLINIQEATMKELTGYYNEYAPMFGKKTIKKFEDRMTAEIRVKTLMLDLEALAAEEASGDGEDSAWGRRSYDQKPSELGTLLGVKHDEKTQEALKNLNGKQEKTPTKVDISHTEDWLGKDLHDGHHKCPHCGVDLSNGYVTYGAEVNGKKIKFDSHQICCLACNGEFGPKLPGKRETKDNGQAGQVRDAMKESLKLDRTIRVVGQKTTYQNAFQMWKAHPDWMTSAQQDRLTSQLYAAAKKGERIQVEINGRKFELVNVG